MKHIEVSLLAQNAIYTSHYQTKFTINPKSQCSVLIQLLQSIVSTLKCYVRFTVDVRGCSIDPASYLASKARDFWGAKILVLGLTSDPHVPMHASDANISYIGLSTVHDCGRPWMCVQGRPQCCCVNVALPASTLQCHQEPFKEQFNNHLQDIEFEVGLCTQFTFYTPFICVISRSTSHPCRTVQQ